MSNTIWKGMEREIATWMGCKRNPLSGRNNYDDAGGKRAGDVITPIKWDTIVETKTNKYYPKSGIWTRIIDTKEDMKDMERSSFFHFERRLGNKKIYMLATDEKWMEKICGFIARELERSSNENS